MSRNRGALLGLAALGTGGLILLLGDDMGQKPRPKRKRFPKGKPLPRAFDRFFDRWRDAVPVEFMRALARWESAFNPNDTRGPAWGLMQVVEVVRRAWNEEQGESVTRQQLLDPDTNVRIASDLLNRIADAYDRNYGDRVPNMREDWSNPRFVELVVAGWNAGWSRRGGVQRVVEFLISRGQTDITVDDVFRWAEKAGAIRFLSMPQRLRFAKLVASTYVNEVRIAANEGATV